MKYFYFFVFFLFISCENKEKILIEKNISFEIPNYLKSTKTLNQDAYLQYQNLENELYLFVIKEKESSIIDTFKNLGHKKVTLEIISKSVINDFSSKLQDFKVIKETKKGNLNVIEFSVKINYLSLYYKLVIFQKDKVYYQMFIWTLEDFKDKNIQTIDSIIQSIKMD